VNTLARINRPFGTSLTRVAALPQGARRSMRDPFAQKGQPWGLYLLLLILIGALAGAWRMGLIDPWMAQMGVTSPEESAEPAAEEDGDAPSANAAEAPAEPAAAESAADAAAQPAADATPPTAEEDTPPKPETESEPEPEPAPSD